VNARAEDVAYASPVGGHLVTMSIGTEGATMRYSHKAGTDSVFIAKWGSSCTALWSADGERVVSVREHSTDGWCEVFSVGTASLSPGHRITDKIPLRVPGLTHWHATASAWDGGQSVWVRVSCHGDGGAREGIFLVKAHDGTVIKAFEQIQVLPEKERGQ
jgi:hypothetical protein